jgi:hypothetical protein
MVHARAVVTEMGGAAATSFFLRCCLGVKQGTCSQMLLRSAPSSINRFSRFLTASANPQAGHRPLSKEQTERTFIAIKPDAIQVLEHELVRAMKINKKISESFERASPRTQTNLLLHVKTSMCCIVHTHAHSVHLLERSLADLKNADSN